MSDIIFREASAGELERWDDFVAKSINGTIFHTRAFLSYHEKRFAETERWVVAVKGENVLAQFAYALIEDTDERLIALSPYGASYGGIVLAQQPSYSEASNIVKALLAYLNSEVIGACRLIHPIACCAPFTLDTFTFSLLEQGFISISREISSVVDLSGQCINEAVSSRARNMERKARHAGLEFRHDAPIADFWIPMEATFSRHGKQPTHSKDELERLCILFPDSVKLDVAYFNGLPVGGVCYFRINSLVMNSFYFCQTPEGMALNSLNLLIMEGLNLAQKDGYKWMDFGTSTVGMNARPSIFLFKESFSKQGMFRETLEWCAP